MTMRLQHGVPSFPDPTVANGGQAIGSRRARRNDKADKAERLFKTSDSELALTCRRSAPLSRPGPGSQSRCSGRSQEQPGLSQGKPQFSDRDWSANHRDMGPFQGRTTPTRAY